MIDQAITDAAEKGARQALAAHVPRLALTVTEVARSTGAGVTTVRRWITDGHLARVPHTDRVLIPVASLEAFVHLGLCVDLVGGTHDSALGRGRRTGRHHRHTPTLSECRVAPAPAQGRGPSRSAFDSRPGAIRVGRLAPGATGASRRTVDDHRPRQGARLAR